MQEKLYDKSLVRPTVSRREKQKNNFARQIAVADYYDQFFGDYRDNKRLNKFKINYDLANGRLDTSLYDVEDDYCMIDGERVTISKGEIPHIPMTSLVIKSLYGEQLQRPWKISVDDESPLKDSIQTEEWKKQLKAYIQTNVITPYEDQAMERIMAEVGQLDQSLLSPEEIQNLQQQIQQQVQSEVAFNTPEELLEYMSNDYYNDRIDSRHKIRHGEIKRTKEFKYSIPLVESLDFTKKDLPIDPYFLGLWLGDGSSKRPGITTQDKEIVDYCYKIADEHGLSISINENKNKTCPTYFLSGGLAKKGEPINRALINKFKSLNLFGNKHIPEIYKTASTEQRLELLRGLMDSDGSAGQGYAYFSNSNKVLAYDTLDLCRSLGMYVHIKEREGTLNGIKYKNTYNVVVKTDKKIFNLSRKHDLHTEHQPKGKFGTGRLSRVKIVGIEEVPNADGCCISVDSYDNTYVTKDYIVTHNSFNVFLGLLLHEWLFSGVKKQSDYKSVNNALNFGLAASDTKALARSIANLDRAYFSFPGQYDFPTKVKGKTVKYWGPFYKNTRGQWRVASGASEVKHIVKTKQGKTLINGSMVQISPIVANNDKIFTGDRFRLGIIEEGGFVSNLKNIFISAQDAFKVGKTTTGSIYVIGTGGDLDKIQDAKEMFEDPESFNIFPIPNYWAKSTTVEKKCGMFVGAYYKAEELKQNGNTKLKEALLDVVIDREEKRSKWSRLEFSKELSFNPIYPKELLRPTTKSPVPQQELAAWRDRLVDDKVMEKTAAIGSFKYRNGKVEFQTDLEKTMTPILEWGKDEKLEDQTGAWIIHEFLSLSEIST